MLNVNQRTSALVNIEPENPYWIDALFETDSMFIMNNQRNQQELMKLKYINGFLFMQRADGIYATADFRDKKSLVATTVAKNAYVVWRRLTDINQLLPVLVGDELFNPLTGESFGTCTEYRQISEVSNGKGKYVKLSDGKFAIKLDSLGKDCNEAFKDIRLLTWTGAKLDGDEVVVGLDDIVFKSSEIKPYMTSGKYYCMTSNRSTIEGYSGYTISKTFKPGRIFKEVYIDE